MKKTAMVMAAMMALSLTACGSGSGSNSAPATTAATTAAATEAATTEAETTAAEESAEAAGDYFTSMEGPSYTLRCATNHSQTFCTSLALQDFAKNVNERTGGRITIEIYYDAVLGEEKACLEQLQYGGLDFLRGNISPLAEFHDGLNALQMPFIYKDTQHFWDAYGTIGMEMMKSEEMQKAGLYGLTFYDGGARNFYNSKREIHTPADMKGLNIRVQESSLMMGMVEALGGNPQPMPYADVYSGLQTGVIDGAENSIAQYLEVSHYEVAKYLTLDNHTRAADTLIMSNKTREMLGEDDMKVIEQCALESWELQKKLWAEAETEALDKLKDSGVTVTELTADEQAQFEDACAAFVESFEDGKYKDILAEIAALAK